MKKENANVITEYFLAEYFGIPIDEAKIIYDRLQRVVYKNDEIIVNAGDEADGLYFIEDGQATVVNADGEAVNELQAGFYFGEYAILADEPRMSTVKAHGKVTVYKMLPEDFLEVVGRHPKITGRLLKQVYDQITVKHTTITSLTKKSRGVMWSPTGKKDTDIKSILWTYGITVVVFFVTFLLANNMKGNPVWWQLLPVVFLMAFTIRTRRILEGMLLTVLLLGVMLYNGNLVAGFEQMMIEGIGNSDTAETIVIMAMVESVAALLASAGVVTAFKKLAKKYVKSKSGSLFGMLAIMILVCLDECLNVVTAGYCMNDSADEYKVPRETSALLSSFSTAICAMIPFSLWGAYISGWVSMYLTDGGRVFIKSLPFNLVGLMAVLFAILLCAGILPRTKQIKDAYKRVEGGGNFWPAGSEKYMETGAVDGVVGRPINLLLPMLVWIVSSVICGMSRNPGDFAMDAVSGLVITLIFMFVLYVLQRMMSPKAYFETMAGGIENALMPILILVLSERISACLEALGLNETLVIGITNLVGGKLELVPMAIFIICTLICIGLGSSWGMYGIGIPLSLYLGASLGINVPLCLGANLAAGILGESLCPYLDDTLPTVTVIGCSPVAYRKIRMNYWIPMAMLCCLGYLVLGFIS